jgi:hypothetical protein
MSEDDEVGRRHLAGQGSAVAVHVETTEERERKRRSQLDGRGPYSVYDGDAVGADPKEGGVGEIAVSIVVSPNRHHRCDVSEVVEDTGVDEIPGVDDEVDSSELLEHLARKRG